MTAVSGAARAHQGSGREGTRREAQLYALLRQGGLPRAQGVSAGQRPDRRRQIVYKHYVNMGIAVASDAGLVVPNIKDADR
jgi:hypothetical protein